MKLRIAKKILKHQGPINPGRGRTQPWFSGNYSGHQKLVASVRLFKYASRNELAKLALMSLYLRPLDAFQPDDQVDLKFEHLIGQFNRREKLVISKGVFVPIKEDRSKPVYNGMGQIHNFNALPMPGVYDKVVYTHEKGFDGGIVIKTQIKNTRPNKKRRDLLSFLRYQARDNNTRKVPKYHV